MLLVTLLPLLLCVCDAFKTAALPRSAAYARRCASIACSAGTPDPEEVARKYGLEAGLFSALRGKADGKGEEREDGGKGSMAQAADLLKRYGGAYLLTSTSLALISFSICYFAIDNGVNVAGLLGKLGIEVSSTSETVGTVGIAYAVHKAASPIRFPPTVALTPIVARNLFGKDDQGDEAD
jgi:hypothetical protein